VQGRRDGRRGLALDTESWSISAPFVERERLREQQFAADRRLRMETAIAGPRVRLRFCESQAQQLEAELEKCDAALAERATGLTKAMLNRRGPGEQDLSEDVLRSRRAREHARKAAPQRERLQQIEDELSRLHTVSIRIKAQIDEVEARTERLLERRALRTDLRIAAYSQAMFNQIARGRRGSTVLWNGEISSRQIAQMGIKTPRGRQGIRT
jgi:hypothetical protein